MTIVFAEQELHSACQVLFGADLQVSPGFLDYLQLSGIKSAYRKKAMETHPDLLTSRSGQSGELFMAVQQAYESLITFIGARKHGYVLQKRPHSSAPSQKKGPFSAKHCRTETKSSPRPKPAAPRQPSAQQPWPLHDGPIPRRKLLFGHYLYYSGLANWQTITKALVWQRTRRPKIGEIGSSYGWLTRKDILHILKNRALADPFGKSAVRLGFLTEGQLRLLLFQQKRLQKKFGSYFIDNNLLSEVQVNRLVRQFNNHNFTVSSNQPRHRTM